LNILRSQSLIRTTSTVKDSAENLPWNVAQLRNKGELKRVEYDPLEMLQQLRDAVMEKMLVFDTDLMGLSRKYNRLLQRIRQS
jgi:hypothetical protein